MTRISGNSPSIPQQTAARSVSDAALVKNAQLIDSTVKKSVGQDTTAFVSGPGNAQANGLTDNSSFPVEKPNPFMGSQPPDRLTVDKDGVITTPGGYKIEQLGKHEWKITGPDGKHTRVWGDPHVDEGDGGKFDFKRNTAFRLPDGTQINVTTVPWGNKGMTVTGRLDIICGDDRVSVTDIDKGKGKVGTVQKDGFDSLVRFNSGRYDMFEMGKQSDDWAFEGREIVGHHNGGESFKVKDMLSRGQNVGPGWAASVLEAAGSVWDARSGMITSAKADVWKTFDQLPDTKPQGEDAASYDKAEHKGALGKVFDAIKQMLKRLAEMADLNGQVGRRGA